MRQLNQPPKKDPAPAKNTGLKDNLNTKCILEVLSEIKERTGLHQEVRCDGPKATGRSRCT